MIRTDQENFIYYLTWAGLSALLMVFGIFVVVGSCLVPGALTVYSSPAYWCLGVTSVILIYDIVRMFIDKRKAGAILSIFIGIALFSASIASLSMIAGVFGIIISLINFFFYLVSAIRLKKSYSNSQHPITRKGQLISQIILSSLCIIVVIAGILILSFKLGGFEKVFAYVFSYGLPVIFAILAIAIPKMRYSMPPKIITCICILIEVGITIMLYFVV